MIAEISGGKGECCTEGLWYEQKLISAAEEFLPRLSSRPVERI